MKNIDHKAVCTTLAFFSAVQDGKDDGGLR